MPWSYCVCARLPWPPTMSGRSRISVTLKNRVSPEAAIASYRQAMAFARRCCPPQQPHPGHDVASTVSPRESWQKPAATPASTLIPTRPTDDTPRSVPWPGAALRIG